MDFFARDEDANQTGDILDRFVILAGKGDAFGTRPGNPGAAMRHPLGGERKSMIGRRPFQHSTSDYRKRAAGEPCHTFRVTRRLRLALLLAALAVAGPMPPVGAVDAGRHDVSIAWFRSERSVSPSSAAFERVASRPRRRATRIQRASGAAVRGRTAFPFAVPAPAASPELTRSFVCLSTVASAKAGARVISSLKVRGEGSMRSMVEIRRGETGVGCGCDRRRAARRARICGAR